MILAIDPGKDKSGMAVVTEAGKVKMKTIISVKNIEKKVKKVIQKYAINIIVIGDGTGSELIQTRLKKITGDNISIKLIEEKNSTLEAEKRYKKEKFTGWKKIIGFFLDWKPTQPLDDLTAVILAERYIKQISISKKN